MQAKQHTVVSILFSFSMIMLLYKECTTHFFIEMVDSDEEELSWTTQIPDGQLIKDRDEKSTVCDQI